MNSEMLVEKWLHYCFPVETQSAVARSSDEQQRHLGVPQVLFILALVCRIMGLFWLEGI